MKIPELLAPAGNEKALHAAVSSGADAVYLGLDRFNARRNADNFTLDTLERACDYAHLRGSRIYVTMNTIILPDELDGALDCARGAYLRGVDALIVQDVGLAALISRCIPDLRLHVSTQMNVHSSYGIEAAAALGAKRVTLARELSLPEINRLVVAAHELGLEVETFGHGALCICYSGQCFMSSMIGGRSANRGLCAQACRLPYKLIDSLDPDRELKSPGDFLLSPKDLCSIDHLDRLASLNVDSLKIEGRMKSSEYVSSVVSVYREALDRLRERLDGTDGIENAGGVEGFDSDGNKGGNDSPNRTSIAESTARRIRVRPTEQEKEKLASVFSRGFSPAYLVGERSGEMMSYQRPNNRGQFAGRVKTIRDGIIHLGCEISLEAGDLLEFWTRKGNTVYQLPSDFESGRKTVYIPLDDLDAKVQKNDRVFRVRSASAAFVDDEREPRIPVVGHVALKLDEPLRMSFRVATPSEVQRAVRAESCKDEALAYDIALRLDQPLDSRCAHFEGKSEGVLVEAARSKAITAKEVEEHVDRMGSTPFCLFGLTVDIDDGVGLGYSQIHRCRASALKDLEAAILAIYKDRDLKKAPSISSSRKSERVGVSSGIEVAVLATNPDCARAAKRVGADSIYVPALNYKFSQAQTAGVLDKSPRQAGYPKGCRLVMPVVDHDIIGGSCEGDSASDVKELGCAHANGEARIGIDVWDLVHPGDEVVASSLASVQHSLDAEAIVEIGPNLPVVNVAAVDVADALGARCVWLSPELNIHQIKEVASKGDMDFGITVFGAQELMVTEHCLLMSEAPCSQDCTNCARRKKPHTLRDRKGYEFPVVTDALGRSHLYNSVKLDAMGALEELIDAGVSRFMIDATLLDAEQTAQATGRLIHALKQVRSGGGNIDKLPNTTTGHLFRGVL